MKKKYTESEGGKYLVEVCSTCPIQSRKALNHSIYCPKRGYKEYIPNPRLSTKNRKDTP